jgi:GntP family gluconate:H+ symporter
MLGMSKELFLLVDVVIAIVALIVLITRLKVHPFIALIIASGFLGLTSGMSVGQVAKSATVATITGAGIVAPLVTLIPGVNRELPVLATGAGSLILSHVNDAGFWLVKQYFNMSVV